MANLDVMLSSTSNDLPEHRQQAADAARRAGFAVEQMENLTARLQTEDAISVSMEMVDKSEVYVGIFGMRYGFRPPDKTRNPDDISITEMEYRRAQELGMPILIFLMHEEHPGPNIDGKSAAEAKKITDAFFEGDPIGMKKLEAFKEDLGKNHIVGFFKSAEDLRTLVLQALSRPSVKDAANAYFKKQQAEADNTGIKTSKRKSAIPEPPDLYAYPPYSGQNARFVGRHEELRLLDEWATSDERTLLVLEAIGGMGKSALTWRWVQDRAVAFDGIFWYSFYEAGALMSDFIVHALAYLTQRDLETVRKLGFAQQLTELITALKNGRYLLVLDGLERVLVAYHRWNPAQMQDDEVEEGLHYRACTDPRDRDVLRQLASCDPSRILITSRLMPVALGSAGNYLQGVRHETLYGLSSEDARELWHAGGITWSDEGLLDYFINQFGRHSLLLEMLIPIIKQERRFRYHFDSWYAFYGERFRFPDIRVKRHHILEFAYQGLEPEAQKLLSQMAALGNALDVETLNVFNPYLNLPEPVSEPDEDDFLFDEKELAEQKQAYNEYLKAKADYEHSDEYKQAIEQFDALLRDLEDRGLIWWDEANLQYDLHPVVRGYAFEQLNSDEQPTTYTIIYNYFEAQERGNNETEFTSFGAMQNLIAMYNALIGAGRFDDAARLFANRIRFSLVQGGMGLYHKAYEFLLPFFPQGLSALPAVSTTHLQGLMLNQMGLVLGYMHRHEDARLINAAYLKASFEINTQELLIATRNYGRRQQFINRLAQARRGFQHALELAELIEAEDQINITYVLLLEIYQIQGRWEDARRAYEIASKDKSLIGVPRYYAIAHIQQGADRSEIQELFEKAEDLNRPNNFQIVNRLLSTTHGSLELRDGHFEAAISYFSEGARIGYEQGLRDPDAWSGLAQAQAANGNLKEALRIIGDGVNDYSQQRWCIWRIMTRPPLVNRRWNITSGPGHRANPMFAAGI